MSALVSAIDISSGESGITPVPWTKRETRATFLGAQPVSPSSIAEYIDAAVVPFIPRFLISSEALSNIRRIAALLPSALTDFFGFECPLGVSEAIGDFLVCSRASQGREVLTGQGPGQGLPVFFHDEAVWRQIRTFSIEWSNPQSPLFDHVHNMWIEFDVGGTPSSVTPVPSVFIGPDNLQSLGVTAHPGQMPEHCMWLTDLALPLLLGSETDCALRAQIARCINLLPPSARIFQVGLMLARPSCTTRLCVRGVSPTQIAEYLRALDYDISSAGLKELLGLLEPLVDRIDLDMDVADRVLPKLGLECYLPSDAAAIRRFLTHLVSSGLSTEAKALALESWPGMAHERLNRDIWPPHLLALSAFLGGRVHSIFARWLHHVKIVYQPGLPLQAKAYLAVHHLWLAPEQLKDLLKIAQSRAPDREA